MYNLPLPSFSRDLINTSSNNLTPMTVTPVIQRSVITPTSTLIPITSTSVISSIPITPSISSIPSLPESMSITRTVPATLLEDSNAGSLVSTAVQENPILMAPNSFLPLYGVNKYNLLEKIGSGGQGSVYRAENKINGRIIALKVITVTDKNANDIKRELISLEKISLPSCHPFLACYYDHYLDQVNRFMFI